MSDWTGPECGFLYISIIDIISRSALVLFSLLCTSNYHYNKGHLKVEFIKWKKCTSDCYLLPFYSQYGYGELSKKILFLLLRDTPEEVDLLLLSIELQQFSYFRYVLYKLSCIFLFLTNIESILLSYFEHNLFAAVKEIHKLLFQSTTKSAETKFLLPKPSNHWKTDHYWGSDDHGEVDIDSDLNRLASGNIMKYTTVPSQCEWLSWTWTWILLYFDCWCLFDKCPGNVESVMCKQLSIQQEAY